MKKIIISFFVLIFGFCCKKQTNKINSKKRYSEITISSKEDESFNGLGDILISQQNFINTIEDTCPKDYTEGCSLKKLKFNTDNFKNRTIYTKEDFSLKVYEIIEKNESTGTENIKIYLNSENDKILLLS